MGLTFPNESKEYRNARDRLLERELELRKLSSDIADERSRLPAGGVVPEDYVFERLGPDGASESVHMSDLFEDGKDALIVYSFMYGAERKHPCGGCTLQLDVLDDASTYIQQRANFVVVAGSPIERIMAYARERGWTHLSLLSTAGNTYNRDYHGVDSNGGEQPMLNVFQRDGDLIRHFWGAEIIDAPTLPGQDNRSNDSIDPAWSMLDLIPGGRGPEWFKTYPE